VGGSTPARGESADLTTTGTSTPAASVTIRGREGLGPRLTPPPDTRIALDRRPARFETLGDVVGESPGVALFRRGAFGSEQLVSIRGADFDQTLVLIDDVPLTGPDRDAVDLGFIPLDGFAAVEVFRGSAPIRYGGGTIGGVIRLVPRRPERTGGEVEAAGGSFGLARAGAGVEAVGPEWSALASVGGVRADNGFSYVDDNGTFADPTDDQVTVRRNARIVRGNGFGLASWEAGPHRLSVLGFGVVQDQGEPGSALIICLECQRERRRAFGSIGYRLRTQLGGRPFDAFATLSAGRDADDFEDRFGRIGLGREDAQDRFFSLEARTGAFFDPVRWLTLGATVFYRRDEIRRENDLVASESAPSSRDTLTAAGEARIHGRWGPVFGSLRGSASALVSQARLEGQEPVDVTEPFVRVEGELQVAPGVTLHGKVSRGIRLPTTLQLFGNRSSISGNPSLRPERSLSFDAGARLRQRWGPVDVALELGGFHLRLRDRIFARRTSQFVVTFDNAGQGRITGLEGSLRWSVRGWRSTTSLTWRDSTVTTAGFDQEEPLVFPLRVFHRSSFEFPLIDPIDAVEPFTEIDHRSGFFPNPANLARQPSFTSWNLGLQMWLAERQVSLAFAVRNLLDAQTLDLLAFPRPGRSFEGGMRWRW
jgi:iron complex outermembrane receptor protein